MAATEITATHRSSSSLWRGLLAATALLVLFVLLNFGFPNLQPSGMWNAIIRAAMHVLLLAGAWLAIQRSVVPPRSKMKFWLIISGVLTAWLVVIWTNAFHGAFVAGTATARYLPITIFGPILIGGAVAFFSKSVGSVLDGAPPAWLIGIQTYRIFGVTFLLGWLAGAIPGVFAIPAGLGDILTGLFALPIAMKLASGEERARGLARIWNAFGILDMAVATVMGVLSAPGPFQQLAFDHPNMSVGQYPTVMIPAFVVPLSVLLHLLSLRQLSRVRSSDGDNA
jgi:hypothetical protein